MSYKWPIRLRPFKNVFSEGANFAIFSTDLRALLLCLLHCNLTQVSFETCWFRSAKKICLVIQPLREPLKYKLCIKQALDISAMNDGPALKSQNRCITEQVKYCIKICSDHHPMPHKLRVFISTGGVLVNWRRQLRTRYHQYSICPLTCHCEQGPDGLCIYKHLWGTRSICL